MIPPVPFLGAGLVLATLVQPLTANPLFGASPDPSEILTVFREEMDRSMANLHLDDFSPPYFLAYRMVSEHRLSLRAYFGEISYRNQLQRSILYVEARYGEPKLDNVDPHFQGTWAYAPVDPDPESLRQQLWELTDEAYRQAVSGYLRKKARKAREFEQVRLADFAPAKPVQSIEQPRVETPKQKELEGLLKKASGIFKEHADILQGEASLNVTASIRYLLTSEGTRLVTQEEHLPVHLFLGARTRAPDGMELEQSESWKALSLDRLPPEKEILSTAHRIARTLEELREAPIQPPGTAPAILDPQFTGVFFHEALGHKLEGQRQRDPEESQLFKGRVGEKVMPVFLSLSDDPSLAAYEGIPLNGHYRFDSEGIPAQRVVLIERGILRTFLMSRRPVQGFTRSNGHGRSDAWRHPIGRMGNLILEAHRTVPARKLKRLLMQESRRRGKTHGFWLKGTFGGDNPTEKRSPQTLRVRPKRVLRVDAKSGKETLVRGIEFVGTPLVLVNKILAAGNDPTVNNAGSCGAASGWIPVAEITPSLLVSEVELQRLPERRKRPPILPSPLHP